MVMSYCCYAMTIFLHPVENTFAQSMGIRLRTPGLPVCEMKYGEYSVLRFKDEFFNGYFTRWTFVYLLLDVCFITLMACDGVDDGFGRHMKLADGSHESPPAASAADGPPAAILKMTPTSSSVLFFVFLQVGVDVLRRRRVGRFMMWLRGINSDGNVDGVGSWGEKTTAAAKPRCGLGCDRVSDSEAEKMKKELTDRLCWRA